MLVCASLTGCAHLLPTERIEDRSQFESFEAAQAAIERIVPYKTTESDLVAMGLDVHASSNVVYIPYPELITRLVPHPNIPLDALDPGIRDCIAAREGCGAYEFRITRNTRQRNGNFMLDFLNFKRITAITGWRFEGLIAIRDGVVLFRNYGGEPRVDRIERQVKPLGPLQQAGEGAGRLLSQ